MLGKFTLKCYNAKDKMFVGTRGHNYRAHISSQMYISERMKKKNSAANRLFPQS